MFKTRDRFLRSVINSARDMNVRRPGDLRGAVREGRKSSLNRQVTAVLAAFVGVAAMMSSGLAHAQDEGSSQPPDASTSVVKPYKNKGPSGGQTYLLDFESDWSHLRDPNKSMDSFDPLKFIPLSSSKDAYLTLGARARMKYEYVEQNMLGLTPRPFGKRELFTTRLLGSADLHVNQNLRAYLQVGNGTEDGHNLPDPILAIQKPKPFVLNAFGEGKGQIGGAMMGLRAGRQEMWLGNGLIVANREAPNVNLSFDGVRGYADWGSTRVDAFSFKTVRPESNDPAANLDTNNQRIKGLYGSHDFAARPDNRFSVDAFYLDYNNQNNPLNTGNVTGVAYGGQNGTFLVPRAADLRRNLGVRVYGHVGPFEYDSTAVKQGGNYGAYNVDAFALMNSFGYKFADVAWKPTVGFQYDVGSGGVDQKTKTISTYNTLYMQTTYMSENNFIGLSNLVSVSPRISFAPNPKLLITAYYSFLSRYSTTEAVYTGALTQYPATATVINGKRIGNMPTVTARWSPTRHVTISASAARFLVGDVLKNTKVAPTSPLGKVASNTTYLKLQIGLSF